MIPEAMLPNLEVINSLPKACRIEIAHNSYVYHYEKGMVIADGIKGNSQIYFVRKGVVKVFRNNRDGNEVIVDVLMKNDMYGEESILGDNIEPCCIQAISASDVFVLPIRVFREYADRNPSIFKLILQRVLEKNQKLLAEKEHFLLQNSSQRIACFLLQTVDLAKDEENVEIKIPFAKSLLASKLGIRPETFSRALRKLCRDCELRDTRNRVYAKSIKQLQNYACRSCTRKFRCNSIKC